MSTVIYSDGLMASDSRAYSGSFPPMGLKRKIRKLPDGSLVGVTSNQPGLSELMMNWIEAGADLEKTPDYENPSFAALLVKPNGDVYYFNDSVHPSGPLYGDYFAIGSGQKYAYGALATGADIKEAICIASKFDAWTNDIIHTEYLGNPDGL